MDPMFRQPAPLGEQSDYPGRSTTVPLANGTGHQLRLLELRLLHPGRIIEAVTGQSYENWVRAKSSGRRGSPTCALRRHRPRAQWPEATYWGKDTDNPYDMRVRAWTPTVAGSRTATTSYQFGLRVDGFASPPDILQAGTESPR
jgi:hypothetical protein